MSDPYGAFASPAPNQPPAPAPSHGDPYATFSSRAAPDAPGGLTRNIVAGAEEGITGFGALADMINPIDQAAKGWNRGMRLFGHPELAVMPEAQTQHRMNQILGLLGANPENVQATTLPQKLARGVSAGAISAAIPTGEALTVGRMIANGMIGAVSGGASAVAQDAAPDTLKPAAGMAAGLASGLLTHGAIEAPGAIAGAVRPVVAPLAAAASRGAAEAQAGNVLARRATNPAEAATALAGGPQEIIPGSTPTTFQQTGDLGLGALEREQATKNPDLFAARRAEQTAAQVGQLQNIQKDADPNALAAGIKSNFDALDSTTQADVNARVTQAQTKAQALGGVAAPEAHGETIREAVNEARAAAKTRERGLWEAVDPHGDLTGNLTATSQAAREIAEAVPQTAKPMAGEEAAIFDAARELPSLAPVQDLIALRGRVNDAMSTELAANGRTAVYARLAALRGAIQDNLSTTISHQIANETGAVARGTMPEAESTAARIQAWVDEYRGQRAQTGGGGGAGAGAIPAGRPTGGPGDDGAALPPEGGSGGAPGDQGVPGGPTFDTAAAERLAAATAATKARARTFDAGPAGAVTRTAGYADLFRLPDGRVPEKFFHPGPTGYSDMQSLFSAVGLTKALPIIADYAAASLRRAAMNPDGTLDPAKFATWSKANADALRALPPEVASKFADAAGAAQAVTAASAARSLALKGYQSGALAKVMGAPDADTVTRTIGQILGARTAVPEMRQLAAEARKAGPDAVQGLRQAVADHILNRYMSNTEVGASGTTQLKADAFQTFVRLNKPALRTVFSDEEVGNMQRIADDIQRAKRSENAVKLPGGSNTAQDLTGVRRASPLGGRAVRTVLDGIAAVGGYSVGGPISSAAAFLGAHALQTFREVGISRVDQLVTQAMLNPAVARQLLAKASIKDMPNVGQRLGIALRRSALGSFAALRSGAQPATP